MFALKLLLKGLPGRDEVNHVAEHKHVWKCFPDRDCYWYREAQIKNEISAGKKQNFTEIIFLVGV